MGESNWTHIVRWVSDHTGTPESQIQPDSRLYDLVEDSLELVELTMAFEDDHGVDVRHPTRNLATVGDLASYVQSLRVEPERTRPYVA